MTTPNEELIKQLRALGIPDWKTARWLMTEAADLLQSQAERIEALEAEVEAVRKANLDCVDHYNDARSEIYTLRAQLAEQTTRKKYYEEMSYELQVERDAETTEVTRLTALLEQLVRALEINRVMSVDSDGNYTKEVTPKIIIEAITAGRAALTNAEP